jgi:hypothetical protein
MQRNYQAAYDILKPLTDDITRFVSPAPDSLARRRQQYQLDRTSYDHLAGEASRYSIQEPSSVVLATADSLHVEQKDMHKMLRAFEKYEDEFHRRTFFARSIAQVRDDAEYAVAVAGKLRTKQQEAEVGKKLMEKTEDIDDEIKKLEQEMQQLEQQEPEPESEDEPKQDLLPDTE